MYKAAIFDMDGTILDTLEDITASVNRTMQEFGRPERTIEQVRTYVGNGARLLMERAAGEATEEEIAQMLAFYEPYYEAHCRIKTRPYPGIAELLRELKAQGVGLAVVSNKGDAAVKALAQELFEGLFEIAIGEREGIRRKPYPDTALEAMRVLGSAPEESVYIGDSDVDMKTAEAAGIDEIAVAWGFRGRQRLEELGAERIADTPQEVAAWILGPRA